MKQGFNKGRTRQPMRSMETTTLNDTSSIHVDGEERMGSSDKGSPCTDQKQVGDASLETLRS